MPWSLRSRKNARKLMKACIEHPLVRFKNHRFPGFQVSGRSELPASLALQAEQQEEREEADDAVH